MYVLTN